MFLQLNEPVCFCLCELHGKNPPSIRPMIRRVTRSRNKMLARTGRDVTKNEDMYLSRSARPYLTSTGYRVLEQDYTRMPQLTHANERSVTHCNAPISISVPSCFGRCAHCESRWFPALSECCAREGSVSARMSCYHAYQGVSMLRYKGSVCSGVSSCDKAG